MATRTTAGPGLLDEAITFAETAAALTALLAGHAGCRDDTTLTAVPAPRDNAMVPPVRSMLGRN